MFDFLKPKSRSRELISLNLEVPAEPVGDVIPTPSATVDCSQMLAAFKDGAMAVEVKRRTNELLDGGQRPELILFLREPKSHNPIALLVGEPPRKALLVFTSPFLAKFYIETKQLPFEVVAVTLDEVTTAAEDWRKRRFDSFVMDLSPKAPVFNAAIADDTLITSKQLVRIWAAQRTARNWQAQNRLYEIYGGGNSNADLPDMLRKQRAVMELLRDYGSFDVPFVHWMIALIAGMQGDEPGRLAATATLESFGPAFVGRTERREGEEGSKEWANSLALAHLGLVSEFGMLKGPDGLPMKSILKTEIWPVRKAGS